MEYKFLSDGRKVAVVGKINQTEYIVQEIFVTDSGDEIPSGEKFTAKSLHDKPVESYADRRKRELENTISNYENRLSALSKEVHKYTETKKANAEHCKLVLGNIESLPSFDWDRFARILAGDVKYVVSEHLWYKPQTFEERMYKWDNYYGEGRFDYIKTITLLCKRGLEPDNQYGGFCNKEGYLFFMDKQEYQDFVAEKIKSLQADGKLRLEDMLEVSKHVDVDKKLIEQLVKEKIQLEKDRRDKELAEKQEIADKRIKELQELLTN